MKNHKNIKLPQKAQKRIIQWKNSLIPQSIQAINLTKWKTELPTAKGYLWYRMVWFHPDSPEQVTVGWHPEHQHSYCTHNAGCRPRWQINEKIQMDGKHVMKTPTRLKFAKIWFNGRILWSSWYTLGFCNNWKFLGHLINYCLPTDKPQSNLN